MTSNNPGPFAITLYVPDGVMTAFATPGDGRQMIPSELPELDFLPPPWWEGSHTVRLGLVSPSEDVAPGPAVEPDLCDPAVGTFGFDN